MCEILSLYVALFPRYSDRAVAQQTLVAQNSLSFFSNFMKRFWGLFSLLKLACCKSNTKFRITFRYLNMYVSTQKFPQIFLYML